MADIFRKKYGLGGRLITTVVLNALVGVFVIAFGWSLGWGHIVWPLLFSFLIAMCRTASGPGSFTFCIELNPRTAGGVMAALGSVQFIAVSNCTKLVLNQFTKRISIFHIIRAFLLKLLGLPCPSISVETHLMKRSALTVTLG